MVAEEGLTARLAGNFPSVPCFSSRVFDFSSVAHKPVEFKSLEERDHAIDSDYKRSVPPRRAKNAVSKNACRNGKAGIN